ncbi:hypothetical protein CRM22_008598 [Opisthorchis felineus]|uniref:Dedicator of cytokinesis protein 1 n=1 Tax=Opisthorchis felineus TaxID=147828 RepID=A0A4S2LAF0_OPIFE|nr:hypothetical protein CRM22_008598 [Opisthorchis felineus]
MIWEPFTGECKWALVIQSFSDNNSFYLNLDVGDLVYLRRHTSDWYYGFKATCSSRCGAFPKVCVCVSRSEFWSEFNAEIHIMFSKLTSSFVAAELNRIDEVSGFISRAVDLKSSLSGRITEREAEENLQNLVTQLTLGQRELDLPILVRDEKFEPVDPRAEILVDLHKRYITLTKQIKDMKLKSEPFSVLFQFDHLPQAELVMYLASQSITKEGVRGETAGALSPSAFDPFVYDRGAHDSAANATTTYQPLPSIKRLTDNVILNGYHRVAEEVVFTDLNPVQPSEERILLMVMVNRLGFNQSKRSKSGKKSSVTAPQQLVQSSLRRPYGVACVDITRALVSDSKRSSSWFMDVTSLARVIKPCRNITITATGEQFQSECLSQLANQTPVAYWTASREPSTIQTASTSNSSTSLGSQLLGDAPINDFELKSVELVNPLQYQTISRNATDGPIRCGRRYAMSNCAPAIRDIARQEVYITLVSGEFPKGTKQQEKNIEVEISLRDNLGNLSSDDHYWNRNPAQLYRSTVYYHKNRPRWSELFVIPLPASSRRHSSLSSQTIRTDKSTPLDRHTAEQTVPGALIWDHLRFVCRHKSANTESRDKLLGVAFLRLQPSTAIPVLLADGPYQLLVHNMDMNQIESCAYLRETSYTSGPGACGSSSSSSQGFSSTAVPKQCSGILTIETCVCSSEHTTDEHLTKVIFWRRYQEDLHMSLRQGIYLAWKDVELRKFARPLVDSLLQILASTVAIDTASSRSSTKLDVRLGHSVLMALARCYRDMLITEMIKTYLLTPNFKYPTIYIPYLRLLNSILQDILVSKLYPDQLDEQETSADGGNLKMRDVHNIFKKIYWAFFIIVRSRQLELRDTKTISDTNFIEPEREPPDGFVYQVDLFFEQAIAVISSANDQQMRTILLHCIPEVFKDLLTVYPAIKLANWLLRLMGTRAQESCGLENHKLLEKIILSQLFDQPEPRKTLLFTVQQSLTTYFAEILSKELVPGRTETNLLVETWCDLLLSFVSRVIQTNIAETQEEGEEENDCSENIETPVMESGRTTTVELHELLITNGFLRWSLQQLARVYLFIKREDTSVRLDCFDVPDPQMTSRRTVYLPKTRVQRPMESKPSFVHQRLTPILGCLASVVLTLLQQLDRTAWLSFLFPPCAAQNQTAVSGEVTTICSCNVCNQLRFMDLYDVIHELCSLFDLIHRRPPYPAPQTSSFPSSSFQSSYSSNRLSQGTSDLSLTWMNQGPERHPGKRLSQLADAWVEILAAASDIELQLLSSLVDLLFVKKHSVNLTEKDATEPVQPLLRADHWLTMQLVYMIQQCLASFVVSQTHLSVEALPSVIRLRVDPSLIDRGVDLRQAACDLLLSLWRATVPNSDEAIKQQYVSMFLPTVIDMATLPLPSMRTSCVNLIFEAICATPAFVERNFVSEVDRVMPWAGVTFAGDLCRTLEDRLAQSRHELTNDTKTTMVPLDETRRQLVTDLIRQVKVLVSYGEFFNHSSKMSEMLALHNLRCVYEKNNRQDMTLRYLFRLESLHAQCGNDTERGYTLQAISKFYSWSDEPVDTSNISQQYCRYATSSRILREKLLLGALEYLKRGTDWERAIEVCDELIELHRVIHPDYTKLSDILKQQAELYPRIVNQQGSRAVYYYYVLTFLGPCFPSFLRGRFVYRTKDASTKVREMLMDQFPQATFTNTQPDPTQPIDRPLIVATGNLTPQPNIPEHLTGHGVDMQIKSYYLRNQVNCFSCIRHFPEPTTDCDGRGGGSVAEETLYHVEHRMPNIMPIVPVVRVETRSLDRTQMANINVQEMIRRLEDGISQAFKDNSTKLMIVTLTSSITSPVSGGLPRLLKDVEPSDDLGEESNFVKLADSVMELLELQLRGLNFWYKLDPPPVHGAQFGQGKVDGNEALKNLVQEYGRLVRDMSRKFGFSVTHLNAEHLLYGPTISMERRNSTNAPVTLRHPQIQVQNSVQPSTTRPFPCMDGSQLPESCSTLRVDRHRTGSRPSVDHIFPAPGDGTSMRTAPSDTKAPTQLPSSDPPPLPTRPETLTKPDLTPEYMAGIERTTYDTKLTSMRVRRESVGVAERTLATPAPTTAALRAGDSPMVVDRRLPVSVRRRPDDESAPPLPPRPSVSNR